MRISTHIVDSANGIPADQVEVRLSRKGDQGWDEFVHATTLEDGRLIVDGAIGSGSYMIELDLDGYYVIQGSVPFFAIVAVEFRIIDTTADLHVSVVISPHSVHANHAAD